MINYMVKETRRTQINCVLKARNVIRLYIAINISSIFSSFQLCLLQCDLQYLVSRCTLSLLWWNLNILVPHKWFYLLIWFAVSENMSLFFRRLKVNLALEISCCCCSLTPTQTSCFRLNPPSWFYTYISNKQLK